MVQESMYFSSTSLVLENYRDTIYASNYEPYGDSLNVPPVPSTTRKAASPKGLQRLPTSKFAVKPQSKMTYSFTPESGSPTSERSMSDSLSGSPATSNSSFSDDDGSGSNQRLKEIRRRRTPSGSKPRVTDLTLTKSNGATNFGDVDGGLPRYKILSRYEESKLVVSEDASATTSSKPAIPKRNPLRESMRNSLQQQAGLAIPNSPLRDISPNTTSLRGNRSNNKKQPTLEQVIPPPANSSSLLNNHNNNNPYSSKRTSPFPPNTGKRLPALPKPSDDLRLQYSPQSGGQTWGNPSSSSLLVSKQQTTTDTGVHKYQGREGPSMADLASGLRTASVYQRDDSPVRTSPPPVLPPLPLMLPKHTATASNNSKNNKAVGKSVTSPAAKRLTTPTSAGSRTGTPKYNTTTLRRKKSQSLDARPTATLNGPFSPGMDFGGGQRAQQRGQQQKQSQQPYHHDQPQQKQKQQQQSQSQLRYPRYDARDDEEHDSGAPYAGKGMFKTNVLRPAPPSEVSPTTVPVRLDEEPVSPGSLPRGAFQGKGLYKQQQQQQQHRREPSEALSPRTIWPGPRHGRSDTRDEGMSSPPVLPGQGQQRYNGGKRETMDEVRDEFARYNNNNGNNGTTAANSWATPKMMKSPVYQMLPKESYTPVPQQQTQRQVDTFDNNNNVYGGYNNKNNAAASSTTVNKHNDAGDNSDDDVPPPPPPKPTASSAAKPTAPASSTTTTTKPAAMPLSTLPSNPKASKSMKLRKDPPGTHKRGQSSTATAFFPPQAPVSSFQPNNGTPYAKASDLPSVMPVGGLPPPPPAPVMVMPQPTRAATMKNVVTGGAGMDRAPLSDYGAAVGSSVGASASTTSLQQQQKPMRPAPPRGYNDGGQGMKRSMTEGVAAGKSKTPVSRTKTPVGLPSGPKTTNANAPRLPPLDTSNFGPAKLDLEKPLPAIGGLSPTTATTTATNSATTPFSSTKSTTVTPATTAPSSRSRTPAPRRPDRPVEGLMVEDLPLPRAPFAAAGAGLKKEYAESVSSDYEGWTPGTPSPIEERSPATFAPPAAARADDGYAAASRVNDGYPSASRANDGYPPAHRAAGPRTDDDYIRAGNGNGNGNGYNNNHGGLFPPRTSSRASNYSARRHSLSSSIDLPSPRPSSSISNTLPNNGNGMGPYQARFNSYNNTLTPPPEASNPNLPHYASPTATTPATSRKVPDNNNNNNNSNGKVTATSPSTARLPPPPGPPGGFSSSSADGGPAPQDAPPLGVGHYTCFIAHGNMLRSNNATYPVRCQTCAANARVMHKCASCALRICGACRLKLEGIRGANVNELVRMVEGEKARNMESGELVDREPATGGNNVGNVGAGVKSPVGGFRSATAGPALGGNGAFHAPSRSYEPPPRSTSANNNSNSNNINYGDYAPPPSLMRHKRSITADTYGSALSTSSREIRVGLTPTQPFMPPQSHALPPLPPSASTSNNSNNNSSNSSNNYGPPPSATRLAPPRGRTPGPAPAPTQNRPPAPSQTAPPPSTGPYGLPPPPPQMTAGMASNYSSPRGRAPPAPWMNEPRSGSPGPYPGSMRGPSPGPPTHGPSSSPYLGSRRGPSPGPNPGSRRGPSPGPAPMRGPSPGPQGFRRGPSPGPGPNGTPPMGFRRGPSPGPGQMRPLPQQGMRGPSPGPGMMRRGPSPGPAGNNNSLPPLPSNNLPPLPSHPTPPHPGAPWMGNNGPRSASPGPRRPNAGFEYRGPMPSGASRGPGSAYGGSSGSRGPSPGPAPRRSGDIDINASGYSDGGGRGGMPMPRMPASSGGSSSGVGGGASPPTPSSARHQGAGRRSAPRMIGKRGGGPRSDAGFDDRDGEGRDMDDVGATGLYYDMDGGAFGALRQNRLPDQAFVQPHFGPGGGKGKQAGWRSGERTGTMTSNASGRSGGAAGRYNNGYGSSRSGTGEVPGGLTGDRGVGPRGLAGLERGPMDMGVRAGGY